jgi:hypothetical protein
MEIRKLGEVLLRIYDFSPSATIYLQEGTRYEPDSPCVVEGGVNDETSIHDTCLQHGFKNWLNVAVVSDTCDSAVEKSEAGLIAEFNRDCQEGEWLWKMMNFRHLTLHS